MDKFTEGLLKGKFNESLSVVIPKEETVKVQESASNKEGQLPKKLYVTVEAIHAGMTKNKTFYPANQLEASTPTWTNPYNKPVIRNHDTDVEPTGRVIAARFKDSLLKAETKMIELDLEITDSDTIQKVMDKRYLTLSIGGSTNEARCSVCGKNIVTEGWCGHSKGKVYDGKEAHWIIGEMEFDEISWVNVPADVNAQVVHIKPATESDKGRRGESVKVGENVNEFDDIDNILNTQENADNDDDKAGQEPEGQEPEKPKESGEGDGDEAGKTQEADKTPEETIAELTAQVEGLQEQVDQLTTENTNLVSENSTLKAENDELKESAKTAQESVDTITQERDTFRNKNVTLAKMVQKVMAERAVDLAIAVGESKKEDRATLIAESSKKPAKLLESTINTLLDKPLAATPRESTPVGNPGLGLNTQEEDDAGDVTESANGKGKETPKELTLEEFADRAVKFITSKSRN